MTVYIDKLLIADADIHEALKPYIDSKQVVIVDGAQQEIELYKTDYFYTRKDNPRISADRSYIYKIEPSKLLECIEQIPVTKNIRFPLFLAKTIEQYIAENALESHVKVQESTSGPDIKKVVCTDCPLRSYQKLGEFINQKLRDFEESQQKRKKQLEEALQAIPQKTEPGKVYINAILYTKLQNVLKTCKSSLPEIKNTNEDIIIFNGETNLLFSSGNADLPTNWLIITPEQADTLESKYANFVILDPNDSSRDAINQIFYFAQHLRNYAACAMSNSLRITQQFTADLIACKPEEDYIFSTTTVMLPSGKRMLAQNYREKHNELCSQRLVTPEEAALAEQDPEFANALMHFRNDPEFEKTLKTHNNDDSKNTETLTGKKIEAAGSNVQADMGNSSPSVAAAGLHSQQQPTKRNDGDNAIDPPTNPRQH